MVEMLDLMLLEFNLYSLDNRKPLLKLNCHLNRLPNARDRTRLGGRIVRLPTKSGFSRVIGMSALCSGGLLMKII